ncbi:glycosyltransferase family 4 protein [Polaribacter sp. Asnod1-A03]|uniref:glycosyltransferase family 4 protein n=1 Tax=Polaribacter sp. Asnod1-A03 TaxID=3160581 RepID=UPI00386FDB99
MKATLVVKSRFQFFHLARQLEKKGLLNEIYSGYPKSKLKDELGIPKDKIKTFPYVITPYMGRRKFGLSKYEWLNNLWEYKTSTTLDNHVTSRIKEPGYLISMSGSGLNCGKKMQSLGGKHICQRGSTHIIYQNDILADEYDRWGFKWKGINPKIKDYVTSEYEQADKITVPSEYALQSFIKMGIPEEKMMKIPYGGRLDRFYKKSTPDTDVFRLLWVGGISLRKGFMYALEAFQKFKHPNKEFIVIGVMSHELKSLLNGQNLDNVVFKGTVPNATLIDYYNSATAFVMPSIEDGFGIVLSEALASGCPVIATPNSGSVDLFEDGKEGFIVPIRDSKALTLSFEKLTDNPDLREQMGIMGQRRVASLGGWDEFGDHFETLIKSL